MNGYRRYKIGYTRRSISDRIKEFKTGNSSEIYLVDSFRSKWGTKIEASLHKKFMSKKIEGEWFNLTDSDISEFNSYCKLCHDNLELIINKNTYYIDKGGF